ncbi:interleukin-1 receptor type 1-like [Pelobates fuscus]|uniref:interleukin-1 receptor type 1-like n=1 Tax=Pelobates fuscus TaxID=191477 RepID=UPI002FE470FF
MVNRMPLTLYTFLLTLTFLASSKSEICKDEGINFERTYVADGQPVYVTCPLILELPELHFNISWYRNDSQIQMSFDNKLRVHQDENLLKFIPASLEDSEYYMCVIRNTTHCFQKLVKLEVFKYDDGLCYSSSALYVFKDLMVQTINIRCPDLENYIDAKSRKLKWFKDCTPLDGNADKYFSVDIFLTINNVTQQDEGKYTCEASFYYNGASYTISRTGDLALKALPIQSSPAIIRPTNNILTVELGSPVSLVCEVLYKKKVFEVDFIYWSFDDNWIDDYDGFNERVILGLPYNKTTVEGYVSILELNFTEVKKDDYGRKFICTAYTGVNPIAYVMLKQPDPNLQGFLIAFFLSLVFVVIILLILFKIFKVDVVLFYRSISLSKASLKDGKFYDAYIMYPKDTKGTSSFTMDVFVLKVLPGVLERQCSYRLFIFGRDDIPGQATVDAIDEAIAKSRRLILVLGNTSSGLENDFEQQIAMYDALIRNKIKVILVEVEKISDYSNMPESIKYIKQKQGVVRWKGEFTEAELSPKTKFWKNIRYRMPPEQHQLSKDSNYIPSEDVDV